MQRHQQVKPWISKKERCKGLQLRASIVALVLSGSVMDAVIFKGLGESGGCVKGSS